MLNSIMMSTAPLRPIFIFAISKQILPACLAHNILFRLTKKGEIIKCFILPSKLCIPFYVDSRQVLCVPIICRSSEKFKNILLE